MTETMLAIRGNKRLAPGVLRSHHGRVQPLRVAVPARYRAEHVLG